MLVESSKLSLLTGEKRKPHLATTSGRNQTYLHRILEHTLSGNNQLTETIALTQVDGTSITFGQLNQQANQLAAQLLKAINEQRVDHSADRIVAVCLPPSIDLIVSLLAIFKTGSAYVPIDVGFPQDRMIHILGDSKPIFLLTSNTVLKSSFSLVTAAEKTNVPVLDLTKLNTEDVIDESIIAYNHADRDLAVVLYTSGSTGIPKGVRLNHKTILQRLEWQWIRFPYGPHEVGCFKTALTFVDSIPEIWGPILSGKPLQIVPKQVLQDTEKFIELLEDSKITRLVLVPSLLKAILTIKSTNNSSSLSNLKMWICSGEVLSAQLLLDFYDVFPEGTKMCNFYGSTEIMGDVTYALFESRAGVIDSLLENKVPIGIPMFNCALYLLDSDKNLVEKGDIGELYVAGSHLCSGYLNNREMDRFVENHIDDTPGYETMFRTGDYGRFVNGQLYYEGRADSQVKVRGHRIDLNEISSVVNKLEKVSTAAVLCYKAGEPEQEVLAFILPKNLGTIDLIRDELKTKLVSYMRPKVVEVDEMPLLVNGKVDRQKLLQLFQQQENQRRTSGPVISDEILTKEEAALLKTVSLVAGDAGRPVRLTDNFFDIGGNSLNAVAVVTKLRDQGFHLDITDFLAAEQLKDLTVLFKKEEKTSANEQSSSPYIIEPFSSSTKEEIIDIIGTTFSAQEVLAALTHTTLEDFQVFLGGSMWNDILKCNLSYVIKDKIDGRVLAVSVNVDAVVEMEEMDPSEFKSRCPYIFEFLDHIETPNIEQNLTTRAKGHLMHGFMSGIVDAASPAEKVALMQLIEEENIRMAKEKGYSKLITTNTTPLTRDLCVDLLGHKILLEYQLNQFIASDGTKPYSLAPDSTLATITIKHIDEE